MAETSDPSADVLRGMVETLVPAREAVPGPGAGAADPRRGRVRVRGAA